MNRKKEQIQERQESGKGFLCWRSQADSVARLERKVFASSVIAVCAAPSHVGFVKTPELKRHCFYKKSSGYFIFFPASGNRNNGDGKLYNSGGSGYGWTSTPNGSNAWNLDIWSTNAHMNSNNRGNGFPVRCVQASAPVFVFIKDMFCFFLATGYRHYSNGSFCNSGTWGYWWTSTPRDDGKAWRLHVESWSCRVVAAWCSYGFPVRCVQGSAAVWAVRKKNIKQIRYRRESGKACLYLRGQADSVTRLERKADVNELFIFCLTPSHLFSFIKVPAINRLYFYKHSSGYFLFFPAAGVRRYNDGVLYNGGVEGDGWTSTPVGSSNAYRFGFNSGVANMGNTNRTYGFPVRCVQGSAAVWAVRKKEIKQIRYRREFGKGILCRRGQADSVTRLGRKVFANEKLFVCAASSYLLPLIKLLVFECLYFYKHSSGYSLFFPASGNRNPSSGNLGNSGLSGYGWTSVPNGGNAWYLDVFPSNARVLDNVGGGFGFPVRCVQASAVVFALSNDPFVFFPASGFRHYSDGKLYYSGTHGFGWTSTPNGSSFAWSLDFLSGSVLVYSNFDFSDGFPVRCVQASAAVFAFIKDTFVFFPASGFREYSDGSLRGLEVESTGWSSTSDGANPCRLLCGSGYASVYGVRRDYGFPVRCVQASANVFSRVENDLRQIRYRRESGKARLCRRGQADSVTRLGHKLSASENRFVCAVPSYSIPLIKLPVFDCLYFYKHSSGYFLFFPAAGLRHYSDGSLRISGGEGDGWTSTPYNSDNAYRFILNSGNATMGYANRTYGFPVRCVQASAPVFAFTKDTSVFFPASGYRLLNDGSLRNSGTYGYGWTSTPDGSGGSYLYFFSAGAYMSHYDRDSGRSVRCVQASAAVFVYVGKDIEDTFVFFPASGNRDFSDGHVKNSGVSGYAWTSMPDGRNACNFDFYAGWARVGGNLPSYGFSVRCVQASAAVFSCIENDLKQIRYRRESGKACLCRRGQADSVTRLRRKVFASENLFVCAASSYLFSLIKLPVFKSLYFYKHSSGYFLFFPATGFHMYNSGVLSESGGYGGGWSSTPSGGVAWNLSFRTGFACVDANFAAFGRSVRCVQASASVFVLANDTFVFFPASGIRSRGDGNLADLGKRGLLWTATAGSGRAALVSVGSGGGSVYSDDCKYGLAVRCVQASAPVFAFTNDTFVFFPASGSRYSSNGSLYNSGTGGYGWASDPYDTSRAWALFFGAGGANMYYDSRAYGFSVRCVQASAPVFTFTNDTSVFFPAAGYRGNGDGKLGASGSEGDGWTSTVAGGEWVYHLRFLSGTAHVFGNHRTPGFPVRCVQASANVFSRVENDLRQIRYRRESGKARLCRRGQADSVTRLGHKLSASENRFVCAVPSYSIPLIKLPVFDCLYFYKHSSGYFLSFPASGYRDRIDGRRYLSGSWGYGWTSTVYDGELGWDLNLSSGRCRLNYDYRGNGLSVRCVQASAAVFALLRKITSAYFRMSVTQTPALFFPVSGIRNYSDGSLRSTGTHGYGWTSTPNDSWSAWDITTHAGGALLCLDARGFGFSVRCVQASAIVFVCMVLLLKINAMENDTS